MHALLAPGRALLAVLTLLAALSVASRPHADKSDTLMAGFRGTSTF